MSQLGRNTKQAHSNAAELDFVTHTSQTNMKKTRIARTMTRLEVTKRTPDLTIKQRVVDSIPFEYRIGAVNVANNLVKEGIVCDVDLSRFNVPKTNKDEDPHKDYEPKFRPEICACLPTASPFSMFFFSRRLESIDTEFFTCNEIHVNAARFEECPLVMRFNFGGERTSCSIKTGVELLEAFLRQPLDKAYHDAIMELVVRFQIGEDADMNAKGMKARVLNIKKEHALLYKANKKLCRGNLMGSAIFLEGFSVRSNQAGFTQVELKMGS